MKRTTTIFAGILLVFLTASITALQASAAVKAWVRPTAADRCSVCGMFVSKYPAWTAEIVFTDGSYVVFDGAKDMFTYYVDFGKYNPSKKRDDIASMYVMDYYAVSFIDARTAYYVNGSDVRGPMGNELIPFASEADARTFKEDHKGKAVLVFSTVTPAILKGLK
jgi:copper chaperone NosL